MLKRFKDNELQVLVATDIAARGIDIDELPHVVNFDLPHVAEDYVHRIGRTGRAGSSGEAVSLVSHDDRPLMAAIEQLMNRKVESRVIAGFEQSGGGSYRPAQEQPRHNQRPQRPQHRPHHQRRGQCDSSRTARTRRAATAERVARASAAAAPAPRARAPAGSGQPAHRHAGARARPKQVDQRSQGQLQYPRSISRG